MNIQVEFGVRRKKFEKAAFGGEYCEQKFEERLLRQLLEFWIYYEVG